MVLTLYIDQEKKRRGLVDNTGDPARSRSQRIKEQLDAAADDMGGVDNRANRIMMMMMAGRDMVTPARAADNKERRQQKMKSRRDRENSLIIGMEESRTPASDHHVSTVGREDRDADDLPDNGSMPRTAAPERESAIRPDKISLPPLSLLSFPEMPQHGRMSAHHLNRSELFSREYGSEIGVVYDMNGRAYGPRNSYSYGPQQVLKLEQDYSYHNGGQNWQNQGATSDGYLSQRSGSHMPRHSGNSWYLPSMTSVYHQTSINQQSQAQVPTVSGQLAKFHSTYAAQQTTSASSQAQPAQAHALPPMQEFKTANTLLSMQQPDEYHSTHASPVNVANGMGHTNSKSAVAEPAHPEPRDSSDRHAPSVWQGQQSWDNRSGYANNDDYAHATEQTGHTVGHPQAASAKYRQPS